MVVSGGRAAVLARYPLQHLQEPPLAPSARHKGASRHHPHASGPTCPAGRTHRPSMIALCSTATAPCGRVTRSSQAPKRRCSCCATRWGRPRGASCVVAPLARAPGAPCAAVRTLPPHPLHPRPAPRRASVCCSSQTTAPSRGAHSNSNLTASACRRRRWGRTWLVAGAPSALSAKQPQQAARITECAAGKGVHRPPTHTYSSDLRINMTCARVDVTCRRRSTAAARRRRPTSSRSASARRRAPWGRGRGRGCPPPRAVQGSCPAPQTRRARTRCIGSDPNPAAHTHAHTTCVLTRPMCSASGASRRSLQMRASRGAAAPMTMASGRAAQRWTSTPR